MESSQRSALHDGHREDAGRDGREPGPAASLIQAEAAREFPHESSRIESAPARTRHLRPVARVAVVLVAISAAAAAPAEAAESNLIGPLRIRDMTPFNLLRLDMLPAHAVTGGAGSWAIETEITYANTYVMSSNVADHLRKRPSHGPLTEADVQAIFGLGEDAYYVDGEYGLLDLTFHYGLRSHTSLYATVPVYSFNGGVLDGTIENFHRGFGLGNENRDLIARNQFQTVLSFRGVRTAFLDAPTHGGVGDPILGVRRSWSLRRRWGFVMDFAIKTALRDSDSMLSSGTNDLGFQASLQKKFPRQGIYFGTSLVHTDGEVLGVRLGSRVVPTLTAAYEQVVTRHTNFIFQLYAGESTVRNTTIDEIKKSKYEASVGFRSHHGPWVYALAATENIGHYENTPDIGISLTLAYVSLRP